MTVVFITIITLVIFLLICIVNHTIVRVGGRGLHTKTRGFRVYPVDVSYVNVILSAAVQVRT